MANCVNETIILQRNASEASHTEMMNDIIKNFALPGVCAFGIVGNILNLTILTRRKLQKSFRTLEQSANMCLIALALSDLMFCILALLTTFIPPDSVYERQGVLFFYGLYSYFFINVFIMESTMLTVAMSLERYLAICFPLRQDLYLTTRRIKYVIVSTFIFSLLFNIPVIWRFEANPICSNLFLEEIDASHSGRSENSTALFQAVSDSLSHALAEGDNTSADKHYFYNPSSSSSLSSSSPLSSSESTEVSSAAAATAAAAANTVKSPEESSFPDQFSSFTKTVVNIFQNNESSLSSSSHNATSIPLPSASTPVFASHSSTRYIIRETPGKQTEKMAYRIAWAIVGNVIPLILLFFFNVCLCRKIYLSYKMRRQFKRQSRAKSSSHILTLTLVVIVVMFFILVAPSEFLLLLANTSSAVEPILNFMQSLNFSVNFILYCIISPTFRKTLKYIFLCGCYNIYQVSRDWKKEFETSLMRESCYTNGKEVPCAVDMCNL